MKRRTVLLNASFVLIWLDFPLLYIASVEQRDPLLTAVALAVMGVAAALALGAEGVQLGTRFICAAECTVHPRVKEFILGAKDRDTVVTGRPTGHPVRCLRNKLTRKFEELEARCAPVEELEALGVGKLRAAMVEGDVEYGSVMAGQCAAMVREIKPAGEIIRELVSQAEEVLGRLGRLVEAGR